MLRRRRKHSEALRAENCECPERSEHATGVLCSFSHRWWARALTMQQIAGQICGTPKGLEGETYYRCQQMNFSQQGLEYVSTDCSHFVDTKDVACGSIKHQSYSMKWDDIRKIIPIRDSIKVCSEGEGCITIQRFKTSGQAADFAEAMNIYVMER